MSTLWFSYRSARGSETRWALTSAVESDEYIRGVHDASGGYRTFRKDRILERFDTEEAYLACPLPDPAPKEDKLPNAPKQLAGPEIAFTGFPAALRAELEEHARLTGLTVRKGVTVGLAYLCTGPNAGPKKIEVARGMGVAIMDQAALEWLLETGELPTNEVVNE